MKPDKPSKSAPAKKTSGKVFDVRRPGKAPASPTSKPVIMGHKPEAQAAQTAVSGIGETSPADTSASTMLTRRKIKILPTGDLATEEAKVPVEASAPEAPKEEAPKTEEPGSDAKQPKQIVVDEAEKEREKEALAAAALAAAAVSGPPGLPENPQPSASAEDSKLMVKQKLTIQPLSDTETEPKAAEPAAEAQPEPAAEPALKAEQPATESEVQAEPEPEAPAATTPEEESAEPAAAETTEADPSADTTAEPTAQSETQDAAAPQEGQDVDAAIITDEEAPTTEPEADIQPLFDDSGIVVSTHNHHGTRHGLLVFLLIVLVLVLAAVALDVVLDLGLLNLPGVPHTDLLTNR
ncbi:MAG TPA: hypothetical protein VL737_05110 [Candidatus Pristimantibacillus sp.]|nr:hypothetical protein [Candidatus Pristimantibacillus sp.]